jgi:DNA-binding transcriptional MerR regulator
MYTIKRAAERAGVPVTSLRAWERRYGVVRPARTDAVRPARTDAGYRLCDDAAVARLQTMRRLIAAGWSASAAAGMVISGDVPAELADPSGAPAPSGAVAQALDLVSQAVLQRLLAAFAAEGGYALRADELDRAAGQLEAALVSADTAATA